MRTKVILLLAVMIGGGLSNGNSSIDRPARKRMFIEGCGEKCADCNHNGVYKYCKTGCLGGLTLIYNPAEEGRCENLGELIENCSFQTISESNANFITCLACKQGFALVGNRCTALSGGITTIDSNAFPERGSIGVLDKNEIVGESKAFYLVPDSDDCKFSYEKSTGQDISGFKEKSSKCTSVEDRDSDIKETPNCIKYGTGISINSSYQSTPATGKNDGGSICKECEPGYELKYYKIKYGTNKVSHYWQGKCYKIEDERRACDEFKIGNNGFCYSGCNTGLGFWYVDAIFDAEGSAVCTDGDLTVGKAPSFGRILGFLGLVFIFLFF